MAALKTNAVVPEFSFFFVTRSNNRNIFLFGLRLTCLAVFTSTGYERNGRGTM